MTSISRHFTLEELVTTNFRGVRNDPTPDNIVMLKKLAIFALDPIRDKFGPIRVTSAFRSPEVNRLVGGSKDSAHLYGCAADIKAMDGSDPSEIVGWVVEASGIDYDQVIDEKKSGPGWVHIGILRPNHEPKTRRQALVMRDGKSSQFIPKRRHEP